MGYTHYFEQHKPVSDSDWRMLQDMTRRIVAESNVDIYFDDCSDYFILHGVGDDSWESFYVNRYGAASHFVKTARKPYDMVVVAILTVMKNNLADAFTITSDGDSDDWRHGEMLMLSAIATWIKTAKDIASHEKN